MCPQRSAELARRFKRRSGENNIIGESDYPVADFRKPSNVEQLRSDIDNGRMGDKVRVPDPAAAPLGADAEAAGTPLSSAEVSGAARDEIANSPPYLAGNRKPKIFTAVTSLLLLFASIALLLWFLF
jgi:hypothetical protein